MSMKAFIDTDIRGNVTVHMQGILDYETSVPLKQKIEYLMHKNPYSTIILDMNNIEFVGSSGIVLFVETLRTLNQIKDQVRLTNVKNEFLKIFKLYNLDPMDILYMHFDNDDTENLNRNFGNRKNTFQN